MAENLQKKIFTDGNGKYLVGEILKLLALKADKSSFEDDSKKLAGVIAAVEVLNGEGDGSVKKAVDDAIASIVDSAPEAFDTLKEVADWIADDESGAAAMAAAIAKLNGDEVTEGSVAYAIKALKDSLVGEDGLQGVKDRLDVIEGEEEGSIKKAVATLDESLAAVAKSGSYNDLVDVPEEVAFTEAEIDAWFIPANEDEQPGA